MAGFIEHLADSGRRVTVLAPAGAPGWQVNIYSGFAWRQRLRDARVRILPLQAAQSWDGRRLVIADLSTGETRTLDDVDAVVAPTHAVPNDALAQLRPALGNVAFLQIGDCMAARSALEAVFEGHEAGRAL